MECLQYETTLLPRVSDEFQIELLVDNIITSDSTIYEFLGGGVHRGNRQTHPPPQPVAIVDVSNSPYLKIEAIPCDRYHTVTPESQISPD